MFDVLVFLFENYYGSGYRPDLNTLSRKLLAAGFDNAEVHEALDWLADLDEQGELYRDVTDGAGIRVFTKDETDRLSEESLHFISFLEHADAINPAQRELIIDRLMALDTHEVGIEPTKLTTLIVLWNQQVTLDALLIGELLSHKPYHMH